MLSTKSEGKYHAILGSLQGQIPSKQAQRADDDVPGYVVSPLCHRDPFQFPMLALGHFSHRLRLVSFRPYNLTVCSGRGGREHSLLAFSAFP